MTTAKIEEKIGKKVIVRLGLPAIVFLLLGSIDRSNVGFAALQMNSSIGLTSSQYGFGAGILFIGYLLAKYPSIMLYEAIGLRRWLALIASVWGICAASMAFIQTPTEFYLFRVLIGLSEAGLAAGFYLYLSHWASNKYKATLLGFPIVAIPASQVIGGPLSGWLMSMDNPLHMEGWRWMYLIEGAPAIFLAVFALFYFPNKPAEATWLTAEEKTWVNENIKGAETKADSSTNRFSGLLNPVTWVCVGIWYCILAGSYAVVFWLPQALQGVSDLTETQIGFVVALPWLANAAGLLINARHSDKHQERYMHIGIPCLLAMVLFVAAYNIGTGPLALLCLILGGGFLGCTISAFWAIPAKLLKPSEQSIGVVVIHMFGSLAGLSVPIAIGVLKDTFNSFGPPVMLLSALLITAHLLCMLAKRIEKRQAAAIVAG